MAAVFIVPSCYATHPQSAWSESGSYARLTMSARSSGRHLLTESADQADLVIVTDCGFHPFGRPLFGRRDIKALLPKAVFLNDHDTPVALFRGIYASIQSQWYDPRWTRSGFYIFNREFYDFQLLAPNPKPKHLYSFIGSVSTDPVRAKILASAMVDNPIVDVSGRPQEANTRGDEAAKQALGERFSSLARESAFVLCPRGFGASSQRLFEVMKMGRCPVIISDGWVEPTGIPWRECSIRIPEAAAGQLAELLEPLRGRAPELGLQARQVWERHFSPERCFDTVVRWGLELLADSYPIPVGQMLAARQFFSTYYGRMLLRALLRRPGI